jgi:cytochrome c-type biogenesis protein CcmH
MNGYARCERSFEMRFRGAKRLISAVLLAVVLCIAVSGVALAAEAAPAAADPVLEKRVMAVSEELRCLVCQNQTIADSSAPLAIDLRNQVREKMQAGMSDHDIVEYMVARYGDFVRYRPPLKATTWFLWFGPLLLLVAGVFFLVRRLRARPREAQRELNDSERARAASLLAGTDEGK